jgi:hypothetical protein
MQATASILLLQGDYFALDRDNQFVIIKGFDLNDNELELKR